MKPTRLPDKSRSCCGSFPLQNIDPSLDDSSLGRRQQRITLRVLTTNTEVNEWTSTYVALTW